MIVYPAHQPSLITDLYKVTDIFGGQFRSPSIELRGLHCAYLMDTHKSGNEIHHHDLHLEALFRLLQLLQEFLWEIWIKKKRRLMVQSSVATILGAAVDVEATGERYLADRESGE